jgi:Protein-L-isoaspartate(D-aspartate) O-methyltransferase (PCMT)
MPDLSRARNRMVDVQIARRGVRDPHVLNAMRQVPREAFVEPGFEEFAYEDGPLPIGEGQTISQPYVVALMIEAAEVRPGDRVRSAGIRPTLIRSPYGRKGNMMLNRLHAFTIVTLAGVGEALAQATPPATTAPAPADDGSGASWLWIIIGLAILAALIWYFMRGRSRSTAASTTLGSSASSGTATSHPKVFDNDKRK